MTDRDKPPTEFSLDLIDLNLLRIFDILMQERSVTKTAQRTGRTQSAVSHSLGKLRDIFQDELFSRDARRMEPTLRAIELSTVISASLSDIRHVIDRHLHFEASETRRNFRVGLSDYTAATFLPSLIERFAVEGRPQESVGVGRQSADLAHPRLHGLAREGVGPVRLR